MTTIALITGGNRGLGHSTATALAEAGVEPVITYRSDPGDAKFPGLPLVVGDLDSYDGFVSALRDLLRERYGRDTIDLLVNNAGVGLAGSIADTTVADFDEMMNVHFRGMFFLTQKLLPVIADGGRILNFSSGLARFVGDGSYPAYGAMKGAVEVFTRYLAKEVGPRGISANVIAPGATATEFGGGALRDNDQVRAFLAGQNAFGRMGEPDDIAGVVTALLTGDTRWITGQRIEASGGMLL
jgi:NAD(P)-dependent dehydrogenase (short-subunit alcohol dehydrogenase family)